MFADLTCDVDMTAADEVSPTDSGEIDLTRTSSDNATVCNAASDRVLWHASFYASARDLDVFMEQPPVQAALHHMQSSCEPLPEESVAAFLRKAVLLHATTSVKSRRCTTWCQQAMPRRFADYLKHERNADGVDDLCSWLKEWKSLLSKNSGRGRGTWNSDSDEEDVMGTTFCVSGPVGCGKTSLVTAVARDHGFEVIEVSSAQLRSGATLAKLLTEATQSKSVQMQADGKLQFGASPPRRKRRCRKAGNEKEKKTNHVLKQNLIFVDEVDVVFKQDVGFYATLRSLAATTRCPIVLTCNTVPQELRTIPDARYLHLKPLQPQQVAAWVQAIAFTHGAMLSTATARRLVTQRGCDIRAILCHLQCWVGLSPYRLLLDNTAASAADLEASIAAARAVAESIVSRNGDTSSVQTGTSSSARSASVAAAFFAAEAAHMQTPPTAFISPQSLVTVVRPTLGDIEREPSSSDPTSMQYPSCVPDSFAEASSCVGALLQPWQSPELALWAFVSDICHAPITQRERVAENNSSTKAADVGAKIVSSSPRSIPCGHDVTRVSFRGTFPRPRQLQASPSSPVLTASTDSEKDWEITDAEPGAYDFYVLFAGRPVSRIVSLSHSTLVVDVSFPHSREACFRGHCPVTPVVNGIRGNTFFSMVVRALNFRGVKPLGIENVSSTATCVSPTDLEKAEQEFQKDEIENSSDDFEPSPVARKRARRGRYIEDDVDEAEAADGDTPNTDAKNNPQIEQCSKSEKSTTLSSQVKQPELVKSNLDLGGTLTGNGSSDPTISSEIVCDSATPSAEATPSTLGVAGPVSGVGASDGDPCGPAKAETGSSTVNLETSTEKVLDLRPSTDFNLPITTHAYVGRPWRPEATHQAQISQLEHAAIISDTCSLLDTLRCLDGERTFSDDSGECESDRVDGDSVQLDFCFGPRADTIVEHATELQLELAKSAHANSKSLRYEGGSTDRSSIECVSEHAAVISAPLGSARRLARRLVVGHPTVFGHYEALRRAAESRRILRGTYESLVGRKVSVTGVGNGGGFGVPIASRNSILDEVSHAATIAAADAHAAANNSRRRRRSRSRRLSYLQSTLNLSVSQQEYLLRGCGFTTPVEDANSGSTAVPKPSEPFTPDWW